jgi:hypothetical protein
MPPVELSVFEAVGALLPGMLPDSVGEVHHYAHKYGIKVWFDAEKATREHYEAQVVGAKDVPAAKVLAIEVGFHSEHAKEAENEAVLTKLLASEKRWRKDIGKEAEATVFLGRAEHWRRVSETWPDPDLGDPELAFELAARLTDYISAIEPVRRKS